MRKLESKLNEKKNYFDIMTCIEFEIDFGVGTVAFFDNCVFSGCVLKNAIDTENATGVSTVAF